ncbi:LamG domain-containing protein [Akkermansiaceae bacterium]|nr:LamG domain-containing protein [Akkermansiaceae bacterium]
MKKQLISLATIVASSSFALGAPILHWQLDESSGNTAADSSGNAIDGTWEGTVGAPGWNPSAGVDGGSVVFSGVDADSFINDTFSAITEMPVTASIWVKTMATQKDGILYVGDGATGNSYYIIGAQNGAARIVARNTAEVIGGSTTLVNDGGWHHVLAVYTSSAERSLYVDGIFQTTNTVDVPDLLPTRFGLGALTRNTPHAPVDLFTGEVDDVALWDRSFTPADAAALNGLGVLGAGNAADLDPLIDGYNGQTVATIDGKDWDYTTGLAGAIGTTGGSVVSRNAFIVLDDLGNGMQMVSLPGNPAINSFGISPLEVYLGETATLSWDIGNAVTITIDGGVGEVANPSGTHEVTPSESTTYTLTATNGNGSTLAEASITVIPEPVIISFVGTPTAIFAGEEVNLNWEVENFTSLEINQEVGSVPGPIDGTLVSPAVTTTYTLTATNDTTTATADVVVTVYPAPGPSELLLHWPLDEGEGTTTADLAGLNPGIFNEAGGAIAWDTGFIGGGSVTFPNLGGVSVRAYAQLVTDFPFTMAGWVKTTDSANDTFAVLGTGQSFQYYSMLVRNGTAQVLKRSGGFFTQNGTAVNDDAWHYVVGVYSHPGSMSVYVDGVFVGENTMDSGAFVAPDRFAIGALDRTDASVVDPFSGSVDDVSFWSGILNASEIASLHGGGAGLGLNASDVNALLIGFEAGESVSAAGQTWSPVSGLTGPVGTTEGSLISGDAKIVLDDAGNGMAGSLGGFLITDISRDATGTTLVWDSAPGASYIVQFSTDLVDWSEEVDDNVDSGGTSTTFKDTDPTRNAEPTGFYRVLR